MSKRCIMQDGVRTVRIKTGNYNSGSYKKILVIDKNIEIANQAAELLYESVVNVWAPAAYEFHTAESAVSESAHDTMALIHRVFDKMGKNDMLYFLFDPQDYKKKEIEEITHTSTWRRSWIHPSVVVCSYSNLGYYEQIDLFQKKYYVSGNARYYNIVNHFIVKPDVSPHFTGECRCHLVHKLNGY